MQKVYKAVATRLDGTYGSVAAPDELTVSYKIGQWTFPKVGRLFAFSEPDPAIKWWPGFNWIVILEGYGIEPVHLPSAPDIYHQAEMDKLIEFWLNPEGISLQEGGSTPQCGLSNRLQAPSHLRHLPRPRAV